MATAIYKSGQGYWTRTVSAVAVGVIGLAGGVWLYQQMAGANIYARGITAGVFMAIVAAVIYYVYGVNRKAVDFFIATEGELKKVNWSTRREIVGSTWVVMIVAFTIALVLFVVDIIFKQFFSAIGVLQSDSEFLIWIKSLFGG
jgi:preprotein translocase SecE subunit